MSNEMNKEMSQGTDVQTEERYQVTKRDLRKTAARYNFMAVSYTHLTLPTILLV